MIFTILLMPVAHLINAQETETSTEETAIDPAVLHQIKTQAMERQEEMLNIFGEGPYSPDMENSLQHALQAMEQAQNFAETNPQAAAQQYLRAMKHYRNALRNHLRENPEIVDEFEDPEVTETADDDVEIVTEKEIEDAKTQLLKRFEERFREQIRSMIDNVEELENDMLPQDAEKARNTLQHTLEKLLRIQQRIESGEVDGAVDDLEETSETLDDELEGMDDQATAHMLKEMNKLEARIAKIQEISQRKSAAGLDTSEEDAELGTLRGNKNGLKNSFKENKGKGSEQGNQGNQGNSGGQGSGKGS